MLVVGERTGGWFEIYTQGNKRAYVLKEHFTPTDVRARVDPIDDYAERIESKDYIDRIRDLVSRFSGGSEAKQALLNEGDRGMAVVARLIATPDGSDGYGFSASVAILLFRELALVPLARMSRSPELSARIGAAAALERMVDLLREGETEFEFLSASKASDVITGMLSDPSPRVKEHAAFAAGFLRIPSAKRALIAVARDKDPEAALAAVGALLFYEDRATEEVIQKALTRLADSLPSPNSDSLKIATDQAFSIRWAMVKGPDAFLLRQAALMLKSRTATVRAAGAEILGIKGTKSELPALESIFEDPSAWVKRYALIAATGLERTRYLPQVMSLARSKDDLDRLAAAECLAQMHFQTALEGLRLLVTDVNGEIRTTAFNTIAMASDPGADGLLLELSKHSNPDVRKDAAIALETRKASGKGNGG